MLKLPIYLDYMATTPIDSRVVKKMLSVMTIDGHFANPASIQHLYGQEAAQEISWAREVIARIIHGEPQGVIFTSGATESINLAIKGAAQFYKRQGNHIITTQIEHKAVLDTCHYLSREGFSVTYLQVEPNGLLDIQRLKEAIREDTILVSIGHVNNEIGVVQDIQSIGTYLRSQGILFHVDAAQSIGRVSLHVENMKIDLLSLSAHKAYGPCGVGVLYIRQHPKIHLKPMMHGGGQEQGYRSGTLATHQIVGMAEAFQIAEMEREQDEDRLLRLRQHLWEEISKIPGIRVNGDFSSRIAGNLNVNLYHIEGAIGDRLRNCFSKQVFEHLALSKGSACTILSHEPSHVLKAIGLTNEEAMHSFRISMGRFTTDAEVEYVVNYIQS